MSMGLDLLASKVEQGLASDKEKLLLIKMIEDPLAVPSDYFWDEINKTWIKLEKVK